MEREVADVNESGPAMLITVIKAAHWNIARFFDNTIKTRSETLVP